MTNNIRHTFAVCAYKDSPYLEKCIISLLSQTVKSNIYISTSTPSEHISKIADKYNIDVIVNCGEGGITDDWNFARSHADTEYVTIAHQDDIYEPTYTQALIERADRSAKPIVAFCEYYEIRDSEKVYKNRLLKTKRILNFGFRLFKKSRFIRRRILAMGNSVCCPAVMFNASGCSDFSFDGRFSFACDWDAWERLSKRKGTFVYIKTPLVGHRIHKSSATTALTESGRRFDEELIMLRRFWPTPIAKFIARFYSRAADSNE